MLIGLLSVLAILARKRRSLATTNQTIEVTKEAPRQKKIDGNKEGN
jgi:hypothetical protein